jgi:hypothetical protein
MDLILATNRGRESTSSNYRQYNKRRIPISLQGSIRTYLIITLGITLLHLEMPSMRG